MDTPDFEMEESTLNNSALKELNAKVFVIIWIIFFAVYLYTFKSQENVRAYTYTDLNVYVLAYISYYGTIYLTVIWFAVTAIRVSENSLV